MLDVQTAIEMGLAKPISDLPESNYTPKPQIKGGYAKIAIDENGVSWFVRVEDSQNPDAIAYCARYFMVFGS